MLHTLIYLTALASVYPAYRLVRIMTYKPRHAAPKDRR